MTDNKEFYDLLNSLVQQQSFNVGMSDGSNASFKQLKTAQLKELIKTVVDSPLTQAAFSSTVSKIFTTNLISSSKTQFNTVDRLMFILNARKDTLSPNVTIQKEKETIQVDLNQIITKLQESLAANKSLFEDKVSKEGEIEITYGIPTLDSEAKLVEEIYSKLNIDVENVEELRKVLGEAFVNEIAKTIKRIKIQDKTLEFSEVIFKSRIKTVETLPASLIKNIIDYIEKYKGILDSCLTVQETALPIDGSLFSSR